MSESSDDGGEDETDERAGSGVTEGAVPAEPTRASVDLEDARREALADPDMKPGSVHEPPSDGTPKESKDIPKTRPHDAQPKPATPDPLTAPMTYPDDGPLSAGLRKIDHFLGLAEQAVLFAILMTVVLVASTHAIKEKITHLGLWWSFDIIRGGTFTIAMIGAAYATQQQRHLAMDLLSKKIPPRWRLLLASAIEIFTIAACVALMMSGWHQIDAAGKETGRHLFEARSIVKFLPIGAILISIHAFFHLIIHLDYFARGKIPPERARSGH